MRFGLGEELFGEGVKEVVYEFEVDFAGVSGVFKRLFMSVLNKMYLPIYEKRMQIWSYTLPCSVEHSSLCMGLVEDWAALFSLYKIKRLRERQDIELFEGLF
jgi:hypothetical protein